MKNFHTRIAVISTFIITSLIGCGGGNENGAIVENHLAASQVVFNNPPVSAIKEIPLEIKTGTMSKSYADPGRATSYSTSDIEIIENIKSSNIDYNPNYSGRADGTWRWQNASIPYILVYVPAPSNSQEQNYADKVKLAIETINDKMLGLIHLEATNSPATTNFIQISYNTSYVPIGFSDYKSGNYCANVSTAPYSGNPIAPNWQNGISSIPVYINLGNGQCNITQEIVEHEFGHALGLANHFKGFGIGSVVSDEYWDTLITLYINPSSTQVAEIVVSHAKRQ